LALLVLTIVSVGDAPEPLSFTTCADYGNSVLEKGVFYEFGQYHRYFLSFFVSQCWFVIWW